MQAVVRSYADAVDGLGRVLASFSACAPMAWFRWVNPNEAVFEYESYSSYNGEVISVPNLDVLQFKELAKLYAFSHGNFVTRFGINVGIGLEVTTGDVLTCSLSFDPEAFSQDIEQQKRFALQCARIFYCELRPMYGNADEESVVLISQEEFIRFGQDECMLFVGSVLLSKLSLFLDEYYDGCTCHDYHLLVRRDRFPGDYRR